MMPSAYSRLLIIGAIVADKGTVVPSAYPGFLVIGASIVDEGAVWTGAIDHNPCTDTKTTVVGAGIIHECVEV